jgi:hypothetical protein
MAISIPDDGNSYSARTWWIVRLLFGVFWFVHVPYTLFTVSGQPVPAGLANFVDLTILTNTTVAIAITALSAIILWLYVRGTSLLGVTLGMFVIGVLTQTLLDSQGAFHRNEILSLIPLGQFLAYAISKVFKADDTVVCNRAISFSKQMIVATYFIAGITKLQISGVYWVIDSPNAVLQFAKSFYQLYYSIDAAFVPSFVNSITSFWSSFPNLLRLMMLGGLLLEVLSPLALYNKRTGKWFGWLMLAFHIGIFFIMAVLFLHFLFVLILFFILPSYIDAKDKNRRVAISS